MANKEEHKAAIAAAKVPVQAWMDHKESLEQALRDHAVAGAPVIDQLVKVAGANGPYRFAQGRFNFRKEKGSTTYSVHPEKEREDH